MEKDIRKKITILTPWRVIPVLSGGHKRTLQIAELYSDLGHKVEVVSVLGRKQDYKKFNHPFSYDDGNIKHTTCVFKTFALAHLFSYFLRIPPIFITFLCKIYKPKFIIQKLRESDQVILDFPYLYPLLRKTSCFSVLNHHNVENLSYESFNKIVKNIELNAMKNVDLNFFCSQEDFSCWTDQKMNYKIIPYIPVMKNNKVEENDERIFLFVGSQWKHNEIAVSFLMKFLKNNKDELASLGVKFFLIGSVFKKNISCDLYSVITKKNDINSYIEKATFGINPAFSGTGTNIKLAEYLSMKLTVLSTEYGLRGYDYLSKDDIIIFNENNLIDKIKDALKLNRSERKERSQEVLSKMKARKKEIIRELMVLYAS